MFKKGLAILLSLVLFSSVLLTSVGAAVEFNGEISD